MEPSRKLASTEAQKIESLGIEIKFARVSNHVEQCIARWGISGAMPTWGIQNVGGSHYSLRKPRPLL